MKSMLATAWKLIRRSTGDDSYERYLEHLTAKHPEKQPLSRREYFREEQQRKWEGVRRCC